MWIALRTGGGCARFWTTMVRLGWSAAEGPWDNGGLWRDVLAVRWNGSEAAEIGNPQSRGVATWFIVPNELETVLRQAIALCQRRRGRYDRSVASG